MRDGLPKHIYKQETGIVNLDSTKGDGTPWVAYTKKYVAYVYFDTYGHLPPPKELIHYFLSDGRTKQICKEQVIIKIHFKRYINI